jgi:hypothetical protein
MERIVLGAESLEFCESVGSLKGRPDGVCRGLRQGFAGFLDLNAHKPVGAHVR